MEKWKLRTLLLTIARTTRSRWNNCTRKFPDTRSRTISYCSPPPVALPCAMPLEKVQRDRSPLRNRLSSACSVTARRGDGKRARKSARLRDRPRLSAVLSFTFSRESFPMKIIQLRTHRYLWSLPIGSVNAEGRRRTSNSSIVRSSSSIIRSSSLIIRSSGDRHAPENWCERLTTYTVLSGSSRMHR